MSPEERSLLAFPNLDAPYQTTLHSHFRESIIHGCKYFCLLPTSTQHSTTENDYLMFIVNKAESHYNESHTALHSTV